MAEVRFLILCYYRKSTFTSAMIGKEKSTIFPMCHCFSVIKWQWFMFHVWLNDGKCECKQVQIFVFRFNYSMISSLNKVVSVWCWFVQCLSDTALLQSQWADTIWYKSDRLSNCFQHSFLSWFWPLSLSDSQLPPSGRTLCVPFSNNISEWTPGPQPWQREHDVTDRTIWFIRLCFYTMSRWAVDFNTTLPSPGFLWVVYCCLSPGSHSLDCNGITSTWGCARLITIDGAYFPKLHQSSHDKAAVYSLSIL